MMASLPRPPAVGDSTELGSGSESSFRQSEGSFNSMSTSDSASASDPGEEEFDNEALLKATKRLHSPVWKELPARLPPHAVGAARRPLPPRAPSPPLPSLPMPPPHHRAALGTTPFSWHALSLGTRASSVFSPLPFPDPRHVLVVEDDAFTLKTIVGIVLKAAQEMMPHVAVDVEVRVRVRVRVGVRVRVRVS